MKCKILHESTGRMRVHAVQQRMTFEQADILEAYLQDQIPAGTVRVDEQTCNIIIRYGEMARQDVLDLLARFHYEEQADYMPEHSSRELNRKYQDELITLVTRRVLRKLFLPVPISNALTVVHSVRYILEGLKSLRKRKLDVSVLDATAISVSMLTGDYDTASSVMFLLRVGEILEEWTHKKSVDDLARTMALNVDKVWVKNQDDQEILLPISEIEVGDRIVVRTSNIIPLDGEVISGDAMVNQASMTGESLPVHKVEGGYVYAGTVVEEGECIVRVTQAMGGGRYDKIIQMIESSEKLKSDTENRAANLADRLVPYSLGATLLTYLITRNVTKALSILMVDFSCALKLAMPLSVLSAMKESSQNNISVKGGKFLETVSEATTIVFDKTGTLTHANPTVAKVIPFNDQDEAEMLRLAACLEEHYPHSIANAVVNEAKKRNLFHEERHSKVDYVVAHGISSHINGQKAVIGSNHFVFEDEGCILREEDQAQFDALPSHYSHLYLAISGVLSAVICIEDPLREEAADVIQKLKEAGFTKTVMMTGDNQHTAEAIAKQVGIDEYYAEVLPEDKASFIHREHELGNKVIMIGDGVNDSPALSAADVGIAIADGAAIAREIADITISASDLHALITLKELSNALMKRTNQNYHTIISFNFMLIVLGVMGILPPTTSALLHNTSTILISLYSMTNLLPESTK